MFRSIAEDDLQVGLSIYAILVYCNTEAISMFHFNINLLTLSTIRTIIQASKNTIVSENLAEYENQENFNLFYMALKEKLNLELVNVLDSLLLTSEVKAMEDKGWPFLKTNTNISLPGKISVSPFLHLLISLEPSLSTHPVHLLGPGDKLMPSALIPFCAYGSDMRVVGRSSAHFTFPVCSAFSPTLHQGQLCYKLQLDQETTESQAGIEGGLMLFIDHNTERSVISTSEQGKYKMDKTVMKMPSRKRKNTVEIYLPTLSPYSAHEPGSYKMTSLKKMTGTDNFLKMSETTKKCQNEVFEDCKTRYLTANGHKVCGCLPWSLTTVLKEVIKNVY